MTVKILILSALYPPYAFGGAEDCARSFAEWAAAHGHDVHVLMAARDPEEAGRTRVVDSVRITMVPIPHIYPVSSFDKAPGWQKPIWHLQDHFANRAGEVIAAQVKAFSPDVVLIHYLQGFGYRTLSHLARCAVPVVYVLHDLGLACVRMSMFKHGHNCARQCVPCRASGALKTHLLAEVAASAPIGFIAPSQAILDELDRFTPVKKFPHARILNTKSYPVSDRRHTPTNELRLLYVGKLDRAKGVDVLFAATERLVTILPLGITVAGKGPLEQELRARYEASSWVRFLGFVSQDEIADEMAIADLLCVPSLWQENSPGVVIQALGAGLPVAATDRGGLAELVQEGVNGILLKRHDVDDWVSTLESLAADRARLARLRAQTWADRERFDVDALGRETIAFLGRVAQGRFDTVKP